MERLRAIKQLRKVEGLNFAAIRKQLGTADEGPRENGFAGSSNAMGERLRRPHAGAQDAQGGIAGHGALHLVHLGARARGSGASIASRRGWRRRRG